MKKFKGGSKQQNKLSKSVDGIKRKPQVNSSPKKSKLQFKVNLEELTETTSSKLSDIELLKQIITEHNDIINAPLNSIFSSGEDFNLQNEVKFVEAEHFMLPQEIENDEDSEKIEKDVQIENKNEDENFNEEDENNINYDQVNDNIKDIINNVNEIINNIPEKEEIMNEINENNNQNNNLNKEITQNEFSMNFNKIERRTSVGVKNSTLFLSKSYAKEHIKSSPGDNRARITLGAFKVKEISFVFSSFIIYFY